MKSRSHPSLNLLFEINLRWRIGLRSQVTFYDGWWEFVLRTWFAFQQSSYELLIYEFFFIENRKSKIKEKIYVKIPGVSKNKPKNFKI